MSKSMALEIADAIEGNKHELVLAGPVVSSAIENSGLDKKIFSLTNVNYLSISDTCLQVIPDDIAKLVNLTNLALYANSIDKVPSAVGNLSKLKLLDVSRNKLQSLPDEINKLTQLATLNASMNILESLPNMVKNIKLQVLDLSCNKLEDFPDICHAELVLLAEVRLNGNNIKEIPSNITALTSLKYFDIADNALTAVPGEIADINKLKELNLKGNKLKDKRLLKLVDQCRSKQVLDYVRQNCQRGSSEGGGESGGKGKGKKGKGKKGGGGGGDDAAKAADAVEKLCHKLTVLHVKDETPNVKITEAVKAVRPHIVCCIVRGVKFTSESFKRFIQLQTKLHDTVCEKRNAATIATHDLNLLPAGDLTYAARAPGNIRIRPLGRETELTGQALFARLQQEAEDLRKEKKRNVYSGIHRYLYLLEGKPAYPCLMDSSNRVISFPPITNSDVTKISVATSSLFVEVTGAASQGVCRKVLDTLLREMVALGISESETDFHELTVEQVKVVDLEGTMKVVYPSRTDLDFQDPALSVVRE